MFSYNTSKSVTMGKLSVDSWPIPPIGSVIGYSCVYTSVISREFSMLSTEFNTCPPN